MCIPLGLPLVSRRMFHYSVCIAGTKAFRSNHLSQKQQVQTHIVCCDDSATDHSSHDSGHSSRASDHGSSSHNPWSSSHSSSDNSNHSSRHDNHSASSSHSPSGSSHQRSSPDKHSRGFSTPSSSDSDDPVDDTALDIASMFDTTETDNSSIQYRPSSGSYYKQPEQPTNPDFWAYKPVWCQPWSILASGMAFVAGARWVTGGSTVATVVAAVPILVWWYLFLVLVPADFRKYAEK